MGLLRDRAGLLWACLVAYAVVYCAWRSIATGADVGTSLVDRVAFLVPGLLTIALAWLAARDRRLEGAARRGWRLLAAAFLTIELGNLLWLLDWTFPHSQIPLAHVGWLAYYPLLLAGILSFPRATRTRAERGRFWIDTAAVVCGGAMLVVYLVRVPAPPVVSGLEAAVSLAYPVGDVALLMGVAVLALRRREDPARLAYLLLTGGLLIEMAGDIAWGSLSLAGASPYRAFSDVTYMLGWALRGSAAYAHRRRTALALADPRVVPSVARAGVSLLPYASALLGYSTLFFALDAADPWTVRVLATGAAALTALAFASQWLTARENAHLEAERAERRSESRFRALVQNSSDVIAVIDGDGILRYVAPSAEGILGRPIDDLPGRAFGELVHADDRLRARLFVSHAAVQPGISAPVELRIGDGTRWIAMEALATNMLAQPEIEGIVLRLRDVRERKALEEQLMHRALHDPLTGLANRALFQDRLRRARQRSDDNASRFGVLVLDLDDFKAVNDGLGHATGDQVLVEMARRLRAAVRPTDTAARLGGDEFAVLVEGIESEEVARRIGQTVLAVASAPFVVPPREIRLAASVGLALSAPDLAEEETLRQADLALYHAKELGKGRLELFAPGMRSEMLRRHTVEAELRRSIENGELLLVWQPVYSLKNGRMVGAEALVRWRHPQRGIVAPAEFIDLAESSGLIEPLGQWVIEDACRQGAEWNRDVKRPFHVGVNLSVRQLHDPRVVEQVRAALSRHGLLPDRLVCEITESLLARDPLAANARLRELQAAGVRLALDDFGTGYSSLGRLRSLPIDVLKVDGVFAQDVQTPQGRSLAAAIVELGKAVGLLVIAEGVETAEQAAALRALGCDLAQGFHFGPPVAAAEVSRMQGALLAG